MMVMPILGLLIKMSAGDPQRRRDLRLYQGEIDSKNQFYFVVSLQKARSYLRFCTGSLIADNWVLTATHCVYGRRPEEMVIRYGDYSKPGNETNLYKKVIQSYVHPGNIRQELNDITLLLVERVPIKCVKLLALDHKTLFGLPVTYAGFGRTTNREDDLVPLQAFGGVVSSCPTGKTIDDIVFKYGAMCIAPKCAERKQQARKRDSGGPVLYDGRLIGVHRSGRLLSPISEYISVSPFLEWIKNIIATGAATVSLP